MSLITTLILVIIATSLFGIYGFIAYPDVAKEILGDGRIHDLTYQFLLITTVGGFVGWLFRELDRLRGQRVVLREMHAELLHTYNRTKAVRRSLRAKLATIRGIDPAATVAASEYESNVEEIGDCQLTFEVYAKRAQDSRLWFQRSNKLANSLKTVERYLNKIIKEYQREFVKFSGDPPERQLSELPRLAEFIGPHKEAEDFQKCFKYPMRDALQAIGRAMLK
jgi:hypothetical protein